MVQAQCETWIAPHQPLHDGAATALTYVEKEHRRRSRGDISRRRIPPHVGRHGSRRCPPFEPRSAHACAITHSLLPEISRIFAHKSFCELSRSRTQQPHPASTVTRALQLAPPYTGTPQHQSSRKLLAVPSVPSQSLPVPSANPARSLTRAHMDMYMHQSRAARGTPAAPTDKYGHSGPLHPTQPTVRTRREAARQGWRAGEHAAAAVATPPQSISRPPRGSRRRLTATCTLRSLLTHTHICDMDHRDSTWLVLLVPVAGRAMAPTIQRRVRRARPGARSGMRARPQRWWEGLRV